MNGMDNVNKRQVVHRKAKMGIKGECTWKEIHISKKIPTALRWPTTPWTPDDAAIICGAYWFFVFFFIFWMKFKWNGRQEEEEEEKGNLVFHFTQQRRSNKHLGGVGGVVGVEIDGAALAAMVSTGKLAAIHCGIGAKLKSKFHRLQRHRHRHRHHFQSADELIWLTLDCD